MRCPKVIVEPIEHPHQEGEAAIDPPILKPEVATLNWNTLVKGRLQQISKRIGKK